MAIQWSMTLTQLDALWNTYYPRILGEVWKVGGEAAFRNDNTYRTSLIESTAGFSLPTEMQVRIQPDYNYDYYIDPDGLWLPFPKAPKDIAQALQLYLVQEMPIEMPGFNPGLQRVTVDTTTEGALPTPAKPAGVSWKLWGRDLRETVEMMPRLIAMEWLAGNTTVPSPLPQAIIDQFNQVSLADFYTGGGQITFGQLTTFTDGLIYPGGLDFPVPVKPTDLETIYTAWAEGRATNPVTTYCPVTGR